MLNYKTKNTDSIGADFGYTDKQMDDFGKKMEKFFEEFTKIMYEDDKNGVSPTDTARKYYKAFNDEFNTQELQDLFLIQAASNFFGEAMDTLRHQKLRGAMFGE